MQHEVFRAVEMGLGSYSNSNLADFLMRRARDEKFVLSYTERAALVEAAARLDMDTYSRHWAEIRSEVAR